MDFIRIENVKGIKRLEYNLPQQKGVYILTGENGSGKTTLLAALNRIGDKLSFQKFFKTEQSPQAKFTYCINNDTVTYSKSKKRWCPHPDSKSKLIHNYKYNIIHYLAATEQRMYQQVNENFRLTKNSVSNSMKDALNTILGVRKFSNLQFIKVKAQRGRQVRLRRDNKLYVIKNSDNHYYSEVSFSLGERLLINALDFIENVSSNSLLIIDEIELALHPVAQVRFYDYLKDVSEQKNIAIIISTHSATLIKHASAIHYLENNNGMINVLYNSKPAYILKDLSIEKDNCPDRIILVEDDMAACLLNAVMKKLRTENEEVGKSAVKIVPVGGYIQVLQLFKSLSSVQPFSPIKLHCFLDKDVEDTINEKRQKLNKTEADMRDITLFGDLINHYFYLPITPELGVWNELIQDCSWFKNILGRECGTITFNLEDIISEVDEEENSTKPRERAKKCFKNLLDKLNYRMMLSKELFNKYLYEAYVDKIWENTEYRKKYIGFILTVLHKK